MNPAADFVPDALIEKARAKEGLERVGANILGVVLTDAKPERGEYKY